MIAFLRLALLALAGYLAFAPAAEAQSTYRIRAGDVLRVEVIEDPTLNRSVLVSPDGRIAVPLAGTVQAGGRTIEQVQAALTTRLAPNFAVSPSVFVGLEQLREDPPAVPLPPAEDPVVAVFVMGETRNVGRIELVPGTNLLQAIAQAGGFTNFAATGRIQLRRGAQIYLIDYDAILAGLSPNGGVTMAEGDVIVVPQRRLFE